MEQVMVTHGNVLKPEPLNGAPKIQKENSLDSWSRDMSKSKTSLKGQPE